MTLSPLRVYHATSTGLFRRGSGFLFTPGTTQPTASNTGYGMLGYTSASLVDVFSDVTMTSGQVLQGKRIHGAVSMAGDNCVLQGCEIVGRAGASYNASFRGLITNSGNNNVAQYNHLTQYDPSTSSDQSIFWREGIYMVGGSLTAYRNDIHDVNHLTYTTAGALTLRGNYLHEPGLRTDDTDHSTDPRYPNWSHNDGFHLAGGANHTIEGNNFVMKFSTLTGMNSTANPSPLPTEQIYPNCHGGLFRQANSTLAGVQIKNNWFAYGSIAMQWTDSTLTGGGGDWVVSGNRITPNQGKEYGFYQQLAIDTLSSWGTINVGATNVYSNDSDTPLAWRGVALKAPTGTTSKSWAYNISAHTP